MATKLGTEAAVGAELRDKCYVSKSPEGCYKYAEFLQVVKKEPSEAAELFRDTCKKMGLTDGCLALGNLYFTGNGVQKDFAKALELYDEACQRGSMGACNNAGLVWQGGKAADSERAREYFKRSCDGGLKNGCFNLSGMYLQGQGSVLKDMRKALQYSLRSCELGHPWGCANASRMFRLGDGIAKDKEKAEELKARAKALQMQ